MYLAVQFLCNVTNGDDTPTMMTQHSVTMPFPAYPNKNGTYVDDGFKEAVAIFVSYTMFPLLVVIGNFALEKKF